MSVDLRLMRYVVTVADEGGFEAAARRLHMAQPPLSRQIRELERTLGVDLFHRRPTRVTAAGQIFVAEAKSILAQADGLVARTQAAGRGLAGTIRLGYDIGAAYDTVPRLLAQLRTDHPGLTVEGHEELPPRLERLLAAAEVDAIIDCPLDAAPPGVERQLLRRDRLAATLDAGHPLASRDGINLADLRGATFVFHPRHIAPARYDFVVAAVHSTGEAFTVAPDLLGGLRRISLDANSFTVVLESMRAHLPSNVTCVTFLDPLPAVNVELRWRSGKVGPHIEVLAETAGKLALRENWTC